MSGGPGEGTGPAGLDPVIEKLVIGLMPQARSEAWKVYQSAPHALDLDELTSLAYTGLMMAAARWPAYCAERGFDPGAVQYFAAYCLRRIRGAMLDAMRSADWVTRSMRTRAKLLRDNGADTGVGEAELARRTGLSVRQIRDTEAGVAGRPVAFDAGSHDVADASGVEETAAVAGILGQVVAAMDGLEPLAQVVLALRFHQGREFAEIAAALGVSEDEVLRLHNLGVLAVHEAMLRSVT